MMVSQVFYSNLVYGIHKAYMASFGMCRLLSFAIECSFMALLTLVVIVIMGNYFPSFFVSKCSLVGHIYYVYF